MANPVFVDITPEETWVKVADNVTSGQVWVIIGNVEYLQTYRDAGLAAPTQRSDGVDLQEVAWISATAGIDVYVMAIGDVGRVRVDL